jgi:hypothetical protein
VLIDDAVKVSAGAGAVRLRDAHLAVSVEVLGPRPDPAAVLIDLATGDPELDAFGVACAARTTLSGSSSRTRQVVRYVTFGSWSGIVGQVRQG